MNTTRSLRFMAALLTIAVGECGCGSGGGGGSSISVSLGIAAADFDGDGLADLAIPGTIATHGPPHPSTVSVYLHQATGTNILGSATTYAVGSDTWNTIAADVNDDTHPDIVTVDVNSDTVSLLLNDSSRPGQFLPAVALAGGTFPQRVAAADVGQDGHTDLLVAHSGGLVIHLQNGAVPGAFLAATSIPISNCCGALAVGDLDGDSLPDIALADQGNALHILFQDPAARGTFKPFTQPIAGTTGAAVAIADVDGDGANDLVYAGIPTATGPSDSIIVALQDHTNPGHFLAPSTYATANGAWTIIVKDLNADGHADLLIGAGAGLSTLFQDAAHPGQFMPAHTYAPYFVNSTTGDHIAFDFSFIDLADMNHDSALDIVVNQGPSFSGPGVLLQTAGVPGNFGDYQDLR